MDISILSPAFFIALILVGIMGYAVQRGATCTVAAVDEFVNKRKFNRLASMVEASIWVVGGLVIAQSLNYLCKVPFGYSINSFTVIGAVLLGIGAYVNSACVFGAIARFGSGEWSYFLTPVGYYFGCLSLGYFLPKPTQIQVDTRSPIFDAPPALAYLLACFMIWRIGRVLFQMRKRRLEIAALPELKNEVVERVWSPHGATSVIGITFFFVLVLLGGTWAYTDALTDLARGNNNNLLPRSLLVLALFVGAVLGGWTAGRLKHTAITLKQSFKCFAGGVLMAWGSLLIPGSNDGLILMGLPLLWPHAYLAFAIMFISIGAAMLIARRLSVPSA